ncbi:MAG TPA: YbaK/EbsC family protein [Candidatus Avacidaminococcus intestinavium]|uniref:YbaK/EbsC family protein n=1 Tax=Candidatus Avacidaminococcus intestinavium TaxID=2840684 RepID=A0A9D1MP37_9FIRM|nr:YbaK/EbsC family protein [Candidatus Avacidaminococcus intestinavium]
MDFTESYLRVKKSLEAYADLKIELLPDDTSTAELAAQALGTEPGQIAKTLCFVADGEPVLVVACGDRKIDTKKLARIVGAKKVRMASAELVHEVTGFFPGGVCPFALIKEIPVYLDRSLCSYDITYIAAGTPYSALPIAAMRLEEITSGCWVEVTK